MDFDNFLSDKSRNAYTLDSVNAGITSLNPNGSIVEIMQTRQATRGLLTDKLGIPEGIFNGKGDLEHNEQLLFNNTIAPIMKQIEQELTNKLLAKNFIMKGGAIEFNTRAGAVLKFFPEKLSQVVERLTNAGTYTINAGLIELGHPQIQDPMASKILPKIQLANEAQLNIVKLQGELAAKAAKVSGAAPATGGQPTNKRPGTTTSGEPNKQFEGTGGSSSNNQNQQNIKKKSQGRL